MCCRASSGSGLGTYTVYGGADPESRYLLPGEPSRRYPHTFPSAVASARRGLSQLDIGYQGTLNAVYENDLPLGARDESGYYALQFRASVNLSSRCPIGYGEAGGRRALSSGIG